MTAILSLFGPALFVYVLAREMVFIGLFIIAGIHSYYELKDQDKGAHRQLSHKPKS